MHKIDELAIKTLRVLSVEQITKAASGHPGIALGAAPIVHALYSRILKATANKPDWFNRDRFILAAGHGSALLYSLLHIAGYKVSIDDLKGFRQLHKITAGHPEMDLMEGVDASSGPLGQGIAEAVGLAIAEENLAARFNKPELPIVDHYTYVLCGDGDLQEGVTQEAMSLAGHLALKKLIVLYDSNDIQLDGEVKLANSENVAQKYAAMGWNTLRLEDGNHIDSLTDKIKEAKASLKPTIIEIKTVIGYGSSMAGTSKVHGKPLSQEEAKAMRDELGGEEFTVDKDVYAFYDGIRLKGQALYSNWLELLDQYQNSFPEEYKQLMKMIDDDFPIDFKTQVVDFPHDYLKATRASSGQILNDISKLHPGIIGGSADLTVSTMAKGIDGSFSSEDRKGRNINFGVREHAMAAISNGIALHKGLRPFCSGFFVFADYMKPAIRLAALMKLPVIYVFTHDSIAVGEDGPTHEPIEQLTMLRSIPGINVIRPADAFETKEAWEIALKAKTNPTVLVLTRQNVPLVKKEMTNQVEKGAYVIGYEKQHIDKLIIASGSEVSLALAVQKILWGKQIDSRIISMPSIYLFERQKECYKNKILPTDVVARYAIEMGEASHYYKYLGLQGKLFNINRFGLSGKFEEVMADFGFTPEKIAQKIIDEN
ncbi:MAG: transketolase [Bacilli bacterium]|jgi:transketolase|nr:transketolase [Bacilli bacterium]